MAVPNPYDQKKKQSNVPYPNTQISNTSSNVPSMPQSNVPTPKATTATPTIPRANVPTPPTSDYRSQVDSILNQYREMSSTPFNYNPNTDPRYQAYRQMAQQGAQTASRNAMETMNERGILNSSLTSNQLGQIQQQAEQQAVSAIPQFYEQAYSQRQNELANLANLASMYAGRDDTMFNRGITEAGLTGQYIPSQAQPIVQQLLALKQEAERPGLGREVYAQYKEQGDALRAQLRAMGVDTSWIDSNVTSGQAIQSMPNVFATADERQRQSQQQMQQQQMEYQAARDAIADERWRQEFDEDARRWGLQYALNRQVQLGNLDIARYNANTSRMNAETNQMEASRRQEEYTSSQDARGIQSQIMSEMSKFDNPNDAREWLNANAGYITQQLGADGLQQMYRMADTLYPQQADPAAQEQARQQQMREQAVRMAQSDPNWGFADAQRREQLIQEYMRILGG